MAKNGIKNNIMKKISILIMLALSIFAVSAKVELPSIISNNMILQQSTNVALWGKTKPGKTITISASWSKEKFKCTADANTGKWITRIKTPVAGGPYSITFSDGEDVTISNVLIGEVWYCSGQSNMYMRMRGYPSSPVKGAAEAISSAKASTPVRIYEPPCRGTLTPMEECEGKWELTTPDVVVRSSALAYFFATYLQSILNVPVGVIVSSVGGSSIQSWLDKETIESDFASDYNLEDIGNEKSDLCKLYNGQVAALEPYTFKGMLWYQGCSNRTEPERYTRLQTAYVKMMRERFQNPDAGFYFVQLSPFFCNDPDAYTNGYFVEAQQKTLDMIPHSAMVTTADLGMYANIHPEDKKTPALRLAYLALQHEYGIKPFDATAPTYESMKINSAPIDREPIRISVKSISIFFKTYNNDEANSIGPRGVDLEGFEIAGNDRVFHKAHALACWGRDIVVWSEEVQEPVAVRYAFRNWGPGNVVSNFGIPATPFRTDNWDDIKK